MKENTKNSIINGLKDNVANNLVKIAKYEKAQAIKPVLRL